MFEIYLVAVAIYLLGAVFVALLKGRWVVVVLSLFIPAVALYAVILSFRLARPDSPWALSRYAPGKPDRWKYYASMLRFDPDRFDSEALDDELPRGWVVRESESGNRKIERLPSQGLDSAPPEQGSGVSNQ